MVEKKEQDAIPTAAPDVWEKIRRMMFLMEGFCPNCHQRIRGWKPVLALEIKSELVNSGINHVTGHRTSCAG